MTSLPSRERGLKFSAFINNRDTVAVAPLAGAWIEITSGNIGVTTSQRRSPRGSVD